jgi:AraC family transcriptional regulator
MISRLQIEHVSCQRESEANFYMQSGQSVVCGQNTDPGRYEHGISRSRLLDYSYLRGELIVCNRGIEECVRWRSTIQTLKIDLPDQAFQAIAQEAGADSVEIASNTNYKDGRVAALISAFQADQAAGFLSGRLFIDSIAQALAAALV